MSETNPAGASLVITGDEILLADKSDANGPWLTRQLLALGWKINERITLGDEKRGLSEHLSRCLKGPHRLVIVTGGLGVTRDDLTVSLVADLLKRGVVPDAPANRKLEARRRKKTTPRKAAAASETQHGFQAVEGARLLPNPVGLASAQLLEIRPDPGGSWLVLLPGVPGEVRALWRDSLAEETRTLLANPPRARRHRYRLWGVRETEFEREFFSEENNGEYPGPDPGKIGFGVSCGMGYIDLFFTVGDEQVPKLEERLWSCFGRENFCDDLVLEIRDLCRAGSWRVVLAESCTGGGVGQALTRVAGSSDFFEAGIIAYHNRHKQSLLFVPAPVLEEHGAVSLETARAMSRGALLAARKSGATIQWSLSVTGVAGPGGGSPEKPVGTVWTDIAWQPSPDGDIRHFTQKIQAHGDRGRVREYTTHHLLNRWRVLLCRLSQGESPDGVESNSGAKRADIPPDR